MVHKQSRQVENTRKPSDHRDDVKGFDPQVHDAPDVSTVVEDSRKIPQRNTRNPWYLTASLFVVLVMVAVYRLLAPDSDSVLAPVSEPVTIVAPALVQVAPVPTPAPASHPDANPDELLLKQFVLQTQSLKKDNQSLLKSITSMQTTIDSLNTRVRGQQQTINEYQEALRRPLMAEGVNLVQTKWMKSVQDGGYRVSFILASEAPMDGRMELWFEGEEDGVPLKLHYHAIYDRKPNQLMFHLEKYQEIIAELIVPASFKIDRVCLRLVPNDDLALAAEYTYNWDELEIHKIVSRVADSPL